MFVSRIYLARKSPSVVPRPRGESPPPPLPRRYKPARISPSSYSFASIPVGASERIEVANGYDRTIQYGPKAVVRGLYLRG